MEKKEAMKILKDFRDKSALFSVRTALDTIIPELKENEDERIRKMLIYQMERWHEAALENNAVQDIKDSADAITWLENQNSNADNANNEYWRGYREGKQEVIDKYAELEKQGEEKPTDKVESKFKVGDWITIKE